MSTPRLVAIAPLVLLLPLGCRAATPSELLEKLYHASREETGRDMAPEELRELDLRRRERADRVRQLLTEGSIEGPVDHLHAAGILIEADGQADVALAAELALAAAQMGDDRGFPLAAEAIDRGLMKKGLPQRYGTQYVFDPPTKRWLLYRVDPIVSDAERRAMGVPTLEEALGRADLLNGED